MAKISDMKIPRSKNGYSELIFGETSRGMLVSQIQAALISFGTELQNYISSLIPPENITTIEQAARNRPAKKMVAIEPEKPASGEAKGIKPDYAVFEPRINLCHIIELKSGYTFDTQKSETIKVKLQEAANYFTYRTGFGCKFYVCSYLAETHGEVKNGFKKNFADDQILSFGQFCRLLGVDPSQVEDYIKTHQAENRDYWDIITSAILEGETEEEVVAKMEVARTKQPRLFL